MLAAKEAPKLELKGMRIRYKLVQSSQSYILLCLIDVVRGARKANGN